MSAPRSVNDFWAFEQTESTEPRAPRKLEATSLRSLRKTIHERTAGCTQGQDKRIVSNFGMDKQLMKLHVPGFPNDQHIDREFIGKLSYGNLAHWFFVGGSVEFRVGYRA